MNPPPPDGFVRIPDAEFEAMLARAAEKGAKRALAEVGLDGDEAALDILLLKHACLMLIMAFVQRRATARHAIYGVQWRWLDRHRLGLEGPF